MEGWFVKSATLCLNFFFLLGVVLLCLSQPGWAQSGQSESLDVGPKSLTPGTVFQDCETCPRMVVVPKGQFLMGAQRGEIDRSSDEGPAHTIRISVPFAVGVFEVTRAQFAEFVAETGHDTGNTCTTYHGADLKRNAANNWRNPGFPQTDRDPVVCVSWHDAHAYVDWLSRKSGQIYRLLSESEWEYVARAGSTSRFFFGDDLLYAELCNYANSAGWETPFKKRGGRCRDPFTHTAPVGSFVANGFGVHDVHGNVWEMVEDCYWPYYAPKARSSFPVDTSDCAERVVRGGSWSSPLHNLRSANRWSKDPALRAGSTGFRVARTILDLVAMSR